MTKTRKEYYRDRCEWCGQPVKKGEGNIVSGILYMHAKCVMAQRIAKAINKQ